MKILFVATVDIHIINHHLRIIKKLNNLGYAVDVASYGNFENSDIRNKMNVCFSKNPLSINNVKAYFKIKKILEENQYDIISCHTPLSSFFTRLASRKCRSKVIYTAHGFHFFKSAPFINRHIYKAMERIAARYTDILVTINNEDYTAAKKFLLKKEGKVIKIPGVGIDVEKQRKAIENSKLSRSDLKLDSSDFVMTSVGELNSNKNHIFVFDTLKDFLIMNPHVHYVVCGCGPLEEKYKQYLLVNKIDKQVHLLGYREDIYDILSLSNLFIFPSLREGLPVSIMEAMVAQLPILASDVRGNVDLIQNDVNGLLFDSGNKNDFIDKLLRLYEDSDLCKRFIGDNDKKITEYDVEVVDDQILSLYD